MTDCSPLDMLSEILTDVPELVFTFSPDGCYLFINKAAASFLQADPLDVIGSSWMELGYSAEVMSPLMEQVSAVATSGEAGYYRMATSPRKGSRTLDISLTPLKCSHGRMMAVLAIAHDISEFA